MRGFPHQRPSGPAAWALQNVSITRLVEPLRVGYGSGARQVGTLAGAGKSG